MDRRPSHWPCGLRRRPRAAHLLRLRVRIPPRTWKSFSCECCVLSRRGICEEMITCPEQSYRLWCVVVCDIENSRMKRPWPALGSSANKRVQTLLKWLHLLLFCFKSFIRNVWNFSKVTQPGSESPEEIHRKLHNWYVLANFSTIFNVTLCMFFNSLNDKHQPMHFTFNNILV